MKNEVTAPGQLMANDSIEQFRRLIVESAEKLQEAADMLHRLYSNDRTVVERLTSGPDGLPEGFVNNLLKVAERSLHPRLLMNRCPAYRKIAEMAYTAQEEIITRGFVDVVVDIESGDAIKVDLVKLEGPQLAQVISNAGVRSRDEQRAWLRRKQPAQTPAERVVGPAYQVKRDRIIFMRPCEVTRVEMLRLLEQMVS
jgi:hypothetical protein